MSILVLTLSIYYQPVRSIFGFERLTIILAGVSFIAAFLGVLWVEFYKYFVRAKKS